MGTKTAFIHGGGWITREIRRRPKAQLFAFLSAVWLAVPVCVSIPWLPDETMPAGFARLFFLLLAIEALFIALAVVFRLTEEPRTIVEKIPNPDYDERNLY